MRKVLLLSGFLFLLMGAAFSQGSISGLVTDATTGESIIGANVILKGTQTGASTDIEGKFLINNVAEGAYTLLITFVTYKTQEVEVVVENGKRSMIGNIQLAEEAQELKEVVVRGVADRTSESVLLLDRKKSIDIVTNIGAQELTRKGVSDAESAVVQVTGVSKQEGVKNVFVRGLGDRYNSTSLNGLPLPSENPELKNISLELFSSDIISSIDVNKTFNADMFGDVAGANVNIKTKRLFEDQELKIGASMGVNSLTTGQEFYRAEGTNFLGTASREIPVTSLNEYNFENSFNPVKVNSPLLNSSFSISGGKSFIIGNRPLRTFFVGSMNSEYLYKEGVVRQVNPNGGVRQDYTFDKYEYEASQLAMGNFAYDFGRNNSISYNMVYIHDNTQSVGDYTGFSLNGNDDVQDPNAYKTFVRRQQQNNNTVLVNQLLSEVRLSNRIALDLGGSFNVATGDEPDRRTNFYIFNGDEYIINSGSPAYNHRFFSFLDERDIAARAILSYSLKEKSNNKITVGYNFRSTNRDFESTQFNFDFPVGEGVQINDPDALFNQQSIDNGTFEMETSRGSNASALNPFTYTGNRGIHAGFVNGVFDLSSVLTVNAGLRVETFTQEVIWDTNLTKGADERNKTYFLPSLNVKYSLTDNDILRLASSQSYTFAQFKELAPFFYEDVNTSSFGNPNIKPAENFNVDLRYEHYFSNVELIALTGFYKQIKYPINRGQVTSAANEFSYVNSTDDAATILGAELEVRKTIFSVTKSEITTTLDVGVNLSYLYSNQPLEDVSSDELAFNPTNAKSKLEGASPWLINSDLTLTRSGVNGRLLTTTVLFNYNTDRIYSLGAPGNGQGVGNFDINESFIPRLDFISSYGLNDHFSIGVSIKNILNPQFRQTKEVAPSAGVTTTEIISDYQKGITASVGVSYKF